MRPRTAVVSACAGLLLCFSTAYTQSTTEQEVKETMEILGEGSRNTLQQTSVVRMTQIEAGFLARLQGFVDIGFSFARANRATEWNLGTEVSTRNEIRQFRVTLSSFLNDREDLDSTTRNVIGLDFTRYFSNRWLASVLSQFTQNQELDLDLRSVFGGTVGRHLVQTNRTRGGSSRCSFSTYGGLCCRVHPTMWVEHELNKSAFELSPSPTHDFDQE